MSHPHIVAKLMGLRCCGHGLFVKLFHVAVRYLEGYEYIDSCTICLLVVNVIIYKIGGAQTEIDELHNLWDGHFCFVYG